MCAALENAFYLGLSWGVPGTSARLIRAGDSPAVGPWPHGLPQAELTRVRQNFWGIAPGESTHRPYDQWDRIAQLPDGCDVVIWASPKPWEQAQLIVWIDRLPRTSSIHVMFVHHYKYDRFVNPENIDLSEGTVLLDEESRDFARLLAAAHGGGEIVEVEALLPRAPSLLSDVPAAYGRMLEDLPNARNGLMRSERQLLEILRDGPATRGVVLAGTMRRGMERREYDLWTGDIYLMRILDELIGCKVPLVLRTDPSLPIYKTPLEITAAGIDALDGRLDHLAVNQIPRWFGGLTISGR